MTATQKTKLRAMPSEELQRRLERLQWKRGRMFWRYYFETALRKMEEMTKQHVEDCERHALTENTK